MKGNCRAVVSDLEMMNLNAEIEKAMMDIRSYLNTCDNPDDLAIIWDFGQEMSTVANHRVIQIGKDASSPKGDSGEKALPCRTCGNLDWGECQYSSIPTDLRKEDGSCKAWEPIEPEPSGRGR